MAGDGKQILLDIQLKNQNVIKQLQDLQTQLKAVQKETAALEEQERKLYETDNKEATAIHKIEQAITVLNKQEKALTTQIQALTQRHKELNKELQSSTDGAKKLDKVETDLEGHLKYVSKHMTEVREAIVALSREEQQMAHSTTATAEDFDKIALTSKGLSKTLKQLEKDYANEVKAMMLMEEVSAETAKAEDKVTTATKRHQTGLTQLAMYFNTAGASGRDFIWLLADMTRQLTWGAAGLSSILGMLAGFGASLLMQTDAVKKFINSFKGTTGALEDFKKTLGDIDWQALKAGASLSSLFAVMQQTAQLSTLTGKLKENAVQMEHINILTKDMGKGWDTIYKTVGNYGDTVEGVSKKWKELDKIATKYGVNLKNIEHNSANAAIATAMVNDAIQKSNDAIVKSGVVVQKAKEAEENYINSIKDKEKQINKSTSAIKRQSDATKNNSEQERRSLELAQMRDILTANNIKLTHEEVLNLEGLVKAGKDWKSILDAMITAQNASVAGLLAQSAAYKQAEQNANTYYEAIATLSEGNVKMMGEIIEKHKEEFEQMGLYIPLVDKLYAEEEAAEKKREQLLQEHIALKAQEITQDNQVTQTVISNLETIAAKETDWNTLSRKEQLERVKYLLTMYQGDAENFETYQKVKTEIEKKQIEEGSKANQKMIADAKKQLEGLVQSLMAVWNNYYQQRITEQEKNSAEYLANIEQEHALGKLSEEDYTSKIIAAQWAAQQQKNKLLAEQAKMQQKAAIAGVLIDMAKGIMEVVKEWSSQPWIMGALIALVSGIGAAQLAAIAQAPLPKGRKGGEVKGPSHERGGVPLELEGGEFVLPKRVYAQNKGIVAAMTSSGEEEELLIPL